MSELPPPEYRAGCYIDGAVMPEDAFTDVQMRAYAAAARRAALEEAARACDPSNAKNPEDWTEYAMTRAECAAAIRALAETAPPVAP